MEEAIGRAPKMYWKGARRALKKEEICFAIADGVGLRRIAGTTRNAAVKVELNVAGMTARQRDMLYQHAGYRQWAFNWVLGQCKDLGLPIGGKAGLEARVAVVERKKQGEKVEFPKVDWYAIKRELTQHVKMLPWAQDLCSETREYAWEAVKDAYKHAQRRCREGQRAGWPRFCKRGDRRSFTTKGGDAFRCTRWAIRFGKIGMLPIRNARRHDQLAVLEGARVLRLCFEERAGRWWCSIMFEREVEAARPAPTRRAAGVDLGYSITVSDGTDAPPVYDAPRALETHLRWLQHWGKAMSRRYQKRVPVKEQSRRWWRAKRMVQKIHLRIASIRKDWVEQVSDDLTKRYDVITTEGFDVARFVEHEVGYVKGRRSVLDMGWGMLRTALKRKAEERGKRFEMLEKTDATDQTCSQCGARGERVDGLFQCGACGHQDTRPRNTSDLLYGVATGTAPVLQENAAE